MFGYNYNNNNNNYGPMNALADILGAYWQKQDELGALKDINNINFPDPNQGQQTLSQAAQNYSQPTQAQLTAIAPAPASEIQSNPIDKAIAQNVNGNVTAPMGQITGTPNGLNGSILQAAQNYVQDTGASTPSADAFSNGINQQQSQYDQQQKAMQKAALQKQYDDFAAAKAANPQWYVGDTYVGDDANAKQAALQSQAQKQAQQLAQSGQNFDKRMSLYEQYASQVTAIKANIMYHMVQKYGVDEAKAIEPLVDNAIKGKLKGLGQQLDIQNRQDLQPFFSDTDTPAGKQQAMWAAYEYNNAARQMGLDAIDTNTLGQLLNTGDVGIIAKDLGNGVQFYAVPKNSPKFDNGQYIIPILNSSKGVSPDTAAGLEERHYEHATPSGSVIYQSDTNKDIAGMNNTTKERIAGMSEGNKSSANQIAAAKTIVDQHSIWLKNNPGSSDSDDPNWDNTQRAYSILGNAAGMSTTQQNINDDDANRIYDVLMKKHPSWSDADIKQYISDNYNYVGG
ncbi:hypothetical protein [Pectinatus frisingensis]|uniref:hypothetical protein n=1 Tax=Pectinatus frisingensis TaxID=865 RepID=UPI0018C63437|nr:hypothetical protein [Pectinatus frisingensis]